MIHFGRIALLPVLAFALAGCGGTSTPVASPTPSSSPAPSTSPTSAPAAAPAPGDQSELVFASALSSKGIEPTATLLAQAQAACGLIGDGTDPGTVATELASNSELELEQAGFVLGAGIVAFCPEHQGIVEAYAGS